LRSAHISAIASMLAPQSPPPGRWIFYSLGASVRSP
jgi:hypothetical protein